jgi:hypothetical protein
MKITPTITTAALAGMFSALVWPLLWSRLGGAESSGTVELIIASILVIVFPAHALVVGFGQSQQSAPRTLDTALLKRVGSWLGAAVTTALVAGALQG